MALALAVLQSRGTMTSTELLREAPQATGAQNTALAMAMAAGLLAALALFSMGVIRRAIGTPVKIRLTRSSIFVPRGLHSSQMIELPYSAITRLSQHHSGHDKVLRITHRRGRTELYASALSSMAAFDTLADALSVRVPRQQDSDSASAIRALRLHRSAA